MTIESCGCYGRTLRCGVRRSVLADCLTQRLRRRPASPGRPQGGRLQGGRLQDGAGPGAAILRHLDASILLRTLGRRSSQAKPRR